jgi:Nitroreductase
MELKMAIEQRTSVRNFIDVAIPVEVLRELARRGSCAPSVNNYQPWRFVAITNKTVLTSMARVVSQKIIELPNGESRMSKTVKSQVEFFATFFEHAPALMAIFLEPYETILERGVEMSHDSINELRNFPDIQSVGACVQNILLSAQEFGLGACWMSAPLIARTELQKIIGVAEPLRLAAFVVVGKPTKEPIPKDKKPIDDVFSVLD